jgi:AmmeMemoRadiSam system protein B
VPEARDSGLARLRPAAVAGRFYPSDAASLAAAVERLLGDAVAVQETQSLQGLIVPHAGYPYSGPIAASGYSLLEARADAIDRLVLIGPAHFMPVWGAAVPAADGWLTPLGRVDIDGDLARHASALGAHVDDAPHAPEHALEVQLPFLQIALRRNVPILPVAIGVAEKEWVADLLGALLASGAFLIVSTDLSHYHADATAKALDQRTAAAITARDPDAIGSDDACGVFALRGALEWTRRADLRVGLLDLRTSADTAGDPSRVVGYGAFALSRRPGAS